MTLYILYKVTSIPAGLCPLNDHTFGSVKVTHQPLKTPVMATSVHWNTFVWSMPRMQQDFHNMVRSRIQGSQYSEPFLYHLEWRHHSLPTKHTSGETQPNALESPKCSFSHTFNTMTLIVSGRFVVKSYENNQDFNHLIHPTPRHSPTSPGWTTAWTIG